MKKILLLLLIPTFSFAERLGGLKSNISVSLASNTVSSVYDEGSVLPQETGINFIGSGITCVDNAGQSRSDCTVTASGSGGASALGVGTGTASGFVGVITSSPTGTFLGNQLDFKVQLLTGTTVLMSLADSIGSTHTWTAPQTYNSSSTWTGADGQVILTIFGSTFTAVGSSVATVGSLAVISSSWNTITSIATPSLCSAGNYARGIDVSGNATGCTVDASGGGGASTLEVYAGTALTSPTVSITGRVGDFLGNSLNSGATFQFVLDPATTNYIHNQTTLQSATLYTSSASAQNFSAVDSTFTHILTPIIMVSTITGTPATQVGIQVHAGSGDENIVTFQSNYPNADIWQSNSSLSIRDTSANGNQLNSQAVFKGAASKGWSITRAAAGDVGLTLNPTDTTHSSFINFRSPAALDADGANVWYIPDTHAFRVDRQVIFQSSVTVESSSGVWISYGLTATTITSPSNFVVTQTSVSAIGSGGLYSTYEMHSGSQTGSGLTNCGDSAHAQAWTAGQWSCQAITGTGDGDSKWPVGVGTGTTAGFSGPITSSPTPVILFQKDQFNSALLQGTTYLATINTSSITAQGSRPTNLGTVVEGVWSGTALIASKIPADVAYTDTNFQTFTTPQTLSSSLTVNSAVLLGAAGQTVTISSNIITPGATIYQNGLIKTQLTASRCIQTDASGNLSVASGVCATGGTPGGTATQVQFNDGSNFAGAPYLTYTASSTAIGNQLVIGSTMATLIGTSVNISSAARLVVVDTGTVPLLVALATSTVGPPLVSVSTSPAYNPTDYLLNITSAVNNTQLFGVQLNGDTYLGRASEQVNVKGDLNISSSIWINSVQAPSPLGDVVVGYKNSSPNWVSASSFSYVTTDTATDVVPSINIPNLGYNGLAINTTYFLSCYIKFQTTATVNGIGLAISTSTNSSYIQAVVNIPVAADGTSALFTGQWTKGGDVVRAGTVQTASVDSLARIEGIIDTGGTALDTQLQFSASRTAATTTVRAGSYCTLMESRQ